MPRAWAVERGTTAPVPDRHRDRSGVRGRAPRPKGAGRTTCLRLDLGPAQTSGVTAARPVAPDLAGVAAPSRFDPARPLADGGRRAPRCFDTATGPASERFAGAIAWPTIWATPSAKRCAAQGVWLVGSDMAGLPIEAREQEENGAWADKLELALVL